MDKAVSQQHYAEAEQYRVRLKELGEEKALAAEKEQHASPVHGKDVAGKVSKDVTAVLGSNKSGRAETAGLQSEEFGSAATDV